MVIKKISVDQLQPGMFVSDLNADWVQRPFLSKSLLIESEEQIAKIIDYGIREVLIDSEYGISKSAAAPEQQASQTLEQALLARLNLPAEPALEPLKKLLAEDIKRARRLLEQAAQVLRQAMADVRMGKPMEVEAVRKVAEKIAEFVLRDAEVMMVVCQLHRERATVFTHSINTCVLLVSFAKQLDLPFDEIRALALGGLLHDIGTLSLRERMYSPLLRLNEEEMLLMRSHVNKGLALLQPYALPANTLAVAGQHHERYDGKGYPHSLSGTEISLAGRMAAIADTYDDISTKQPRLRPLSPPAAMRKIFEWSHDHFDHDLVCHFVRCVGIYPVGSLVRLSSDKLAIVLLHRQDSLLEPLVRVVFDARLGTSLPPYDLDLSSDKARQDEEKIVQHEHAEDWLIDVASYLQP